MQFYELLNALLKLLIPYPEKEAKDKSTITLTSISKNKFEYKEDNYTYLFTYTKDYPLTSFKVEDKFEYQNILEILYKKYSKKYKNIFHINTIEMYITQNILEKKLQGIIFTKKEDNIFFNELNKRPKID